MIIVVKFKDGMQTMSLPDAAGTSQSVFDEATGRSVETSSLDSDPPSYRSCWVGGDGSILAARCKMCERDDDAGRARMRVGDIAGGRVHAPAEPYVVVPASMMPDVEFVEADGVRVYEAKGASPAQASGKQAVEQFRRHGLDAQAPQGAVQSFQVR